MSITDVRAQLAADDSLVGRALCDAWTAEVDRWLDELVTVAIEGSDPAGIALVAVGGYGRGELSLQSDIDVLLLHEGRDDIGELADRLWYPIWDARLKLGHAVRTVKEALALAADDLDTATGLLQVRHLAGDRRLTDELAAKAELQWRKRAKRSLATMSARVRDRHAQSGEVAFLLEPDIKEGRGGLRDVHALRWAQAARSILWDTDHASLDAAYDTLLVGAGRAAPPHRAPGRQAAAAGTGRAGRRPRLPRRRHAHGQRRPRRPHDRLDVRRRLAPHRQLARRAAGPGPPPRDLGGGLRLQDGEVAIADEVDIAADPALALAAAAAAARRDTQLDRGTLARLAIEVPDPPTPWPDAVRGRVRRPVDGRAARPRPARGARPAGRAGSATSPSGRASGRSRSATPTTASRSTGTCGRPPSAAPRSPAASAGPTCSCWPPCSTTSARARPGDHTDNGVAMLAEIGAAHGARRRRHRRSLVALCRHHLLLADVATRRDLDDPATIDAVAAALGGREVLGLLAALTEADSLATGPAAWSDWKAGLVRAAGHPRRPRPRRRAGRRRRRRVPQRRAEGAAGRGRADAAGRGRPADRRGPGPARPVQPGGRRAVAARARHPRRRGRRRAGLGHRGVPGPVQLRADDHAGTG